MAVQSFIGLRAGLCAVFLTLSPVMSAIAEDAAPAATGGEIARPSIEAIAIPPQENKSGAQKPADTARETDTREAMCLMREAAAGRKTPPPALSAPSTPREERIEAS